MKIVSKGYISLGLDRDEAEKLLALVLHNPAYKDTIEQLQDELRPRYEYTIQCRDCSTKYTYTSSNKLTKEEVSSGGICSGCSDDYK